LHLATAIGAAVLVVAGYVFLFKALNEITDLQHEINAKLPPARKFQPLFWWFGTWGKLRELQEEVLPGSPRLKSSRRFRLLFFFFLFSAIAVLGIGFRK
jgi:hypothetical protein